MSLVTIHVRVRDNTDEGFARIRTASRNLRRSLDENFGAAGRSSGLRFTQRLGNVMRQGMASLGQSSQGLVQGMSRGLAGSGPALSAALLPVIGVVAMAAGALLAGALTLGFGAAFIGLGFYLLKDVPQVKKTWNEATEGLKKKFREAAEPLIPVIQRAITHMGKLADKFAPHFKKAMEAANPYLKSFLDRLAKGIEAFGQKAWKPMMDAFNELLKNIDIESFFGSLGGSFAYLGRVVKENAREIGMLFSVMLGTLPVIIRIIAFLAQEWGNTVRAVEQMRDKVKWFINGVISDSKAVWSKMKAIYNDYIKPFVDKVVEGFQWLYDVLIGNSIIPDLVNGIIGWLAKLVSPVKKAFDWIAKLKGKTIRFAQTGAQAVSRVVSSVIGVIKRFVGKVVSIGQRGAQAAQRGVQNVINTVKRYAGKVVSIGQRGAQAARQAVQNIINTVRHYAGKTVSVGVRGAAAAVRAVQSVISRIRNFVGKTVSIGVNFFKGAGGKLASALGFAHGGIVGRAAEGGPRSNMTMVGEHGPELVDLAPGSRVRSNSDSRRILSSGGGSQIMHITLMIGDKQLGELMIDPLRKSIRTRGGDVQGVLGR